MWVFFWLECKLFTEIFADGGGGGEDPDQVRAVRAAQQVLSGQEKNARQQIQ